MYRKQDYLKAFEAFKVANLFIWPRYETPAAAELLLAHLVKEQQPPSQITVELGIKALVRNGRLVRIDGKSQADDVQANLEQIVERIEAPDLTTAEIESFSSIHPQELMEKYWEGGGNNRFAVRYRKAVKTFGFQIPGHPPASEQVASGGEVELTAKQYHALDARTLQQKLRNPQFKTQVYRLLAERKI